MATLQRPVVLDDDRNDLPEFAWALHAKLPEPRLSQLKALGEWDNLIQAYLASISFVDSQIGRVLDALDASPNSQETVVVLWSDHGWHLGEKGITGKNSLWERSTRVPLIIAGPGISPGVCDQPAELIDVFPTLAERSNIPAPADLEGLSLQPWLSHPAMPRDRPAMTTACRDNHAVRSARYRLIQYANGEREFYDHHSDPHEHINLASSPAHSAQMDEHARWLPTVNRAPVSGSKPRLLEYTTTELKWEGKPLDLKSIER